MGLFKDVPKPVCWPPPRDKKGTISLLNYAKDRDPYGDIAHLIIAVLFLITIPINPVAASIGFGVLTFYWLLRLHVTWQCITPLLVHPIVVCVAFFCAWSALSLLWSNDVENGLGHLRSMRIFFVLFLLWPIVPHWKWLLGGLVIGVFILNVSQFFEALQMVQGDGVISRTSGSIGGHPPSAGLWCATSLLVLLGTLKKMRSWQFAVSIIAIAFAIVGCVISSGRGNLIGLGLAIFLLVLFKSHSKKSYKLIASTVVTSIILSVVVWNTPKIGTFLQLRANQAINGFSSFIQHDNPKTSTGIRLAWWSSSIRAAKNHPIVGVGLGGFSTWTIEDDGFASYHERWPEFTSKTIVGVSHPHSMYMSTLAEGGIIGSFLLFAIVFYSSVTSWRIRKQSNGSLIICGILVLWLIAGFFDPFQYHAQTLSIFCLVITLAMYFDVLTPLSTPQRPEV